MLLHEATRDSLLGEPDEAGYIEIWEPSYKYKGFSEVSFEYAFFTAIEKIIIFKGDTTFVQKSDDLSLGKQKLSHIEYVLNNSEGDTIKLIRNHFFYSEGYHSEGFMTNIEIISDNILLASYSSKFHQSNLFDDNTQEKIPNNTIFENFNSEFDAKLDDRKSEHGLYDETSTIEKQNKTISPDHYLVNFEINTPSEGGSLAESYKLSITCDFECLTSKLHEVNMDFSYLYKGGYNVWLHE